MISSLRGVVTQLSAHDAVVDVSGVGYLVHITTDHARALRLGEETSVVTVLIPREDEWTLFGFESAEHKSLFVLLRGVTGVGPKTALAILSQLSTSEIAHAVESGDDSVFRRVSGVGQKTASLIIVTLTGKMPQAAGRSASADLVAALTGLGWAEKQARQVATEVTTAHPDQPTAVLIRLALASMASGV
ncbi:MAG: Holliday junction branch migration protein RuvA [Actinomycetota bacterium]|jgi:Holliday junction DNA helicase RuvA